MEIHRMLTPDTVAVDVKAADKDQLLDAVLQLVEHHPAVKDYQAVRDAVLTRERTMSTGVGKGLALPHAKTSAVTSTVAALVLTAEPVEFGALDNEPVRMVFLLVGTPDAKSRHVKILSRVSRLMNRDALRSELLQATSVEELLDAFRAGEEKLIDQ